MPRTTTQGERVSFAMAQPKPSTTPQGAALRTVRDHKAPSNQRAKDWQVEAYAFTWAIGEVGYVHNLTANTVAACNLKIQERIAGDDDLIDTEDERALRVDRAFVGPRGGKKELMRRAALNYRIAGEAWLLGTPSVDPTTVMVGDSPQLLWEFLSCRELSTGADGKMRRASAGPANTQSEVLDEGNAYVTRWWQSDPEFSALPDCAMRRAIPICRELVALTQVIDSATKSRLSADILAVPEGMTFADQDRMADELVGGDEDIDPFIEMLLEHMSAPIEDQTSAAALVPLVLRGAREDIEALRLLGIGKDLGAWAKPLRDEALQRLANALDSPPEMMQGKAELNHWTGFSIDAEFISKHVIPLGQDLAEFLTVSYLRPMLVIFEGLTDAEAERFSYAFDPANVLARADAGTTGIQLWRERIISREAAARMNNVDESDLMTDDELATEMLRDMIRSRPDLLPLYGQFVPGLPNTAPTPPTSPGQPKVALPPAEQDTPTTPDQGGGEPDSPATQEAASTLARVADREMLAALERVGQQGGELQDQWLMLRAEAANILVDHLGKLNMSRDDNAVIDALSLLVGLMTAHTVSTRGAEVYSNGLRVPDWLMLPVVEVACGRDPR